MKADDLLFISLGGAAASIARRIAEKVKRTTAQPTMRFLVLDTDDEVLQTVTLSQADGVSATVFGTQRLNGKGTGGDHVFGMGAFRDDHQSLIQQIGTPHLVVIVTCCGGGTSGACEPLLRLLSERGIANVVFATEPLSFEGSDRKQRASVVVPTILQHANAATIVPLDELLYGAPEDLTMAQSFDYVADRLAAGVSLLWTLLVQPGYLQFDVEHFRQFLDREGRVTLPFTFADATATGDDRAEQIVAELSTSQRFKQKGRNYLSNARTIVVGVLAGDDLRLSELDVLMKGLRAHFAKQANVILGTVNSAVYNGRLEVVMMAFLQDGAEAPSDGDELQPVRKRASKGGRQKALSAVKDRFDDVERTIIDGINYDEPTYLRRNIWLKR